MKLLSIINPQKILGQIILLITLAGFFFMSGVAWTSLNHPTTQINNDIKNKAKKGAVIDYNSSMGVESANCKTWLQGLSKKEVTAIRKAR